MKKPFIGITCDYDWERQRAQLYHGYYSAISHVGGLPFLIAYTHIEDIPELLLQVDGILLTGGQDVDPIFFGETPHPKLGNINPIRDEFEIALCKEAMDRDIPILGICRGIQLMNIAMGGTIYQDLESQWQSGNLFKHSQQAPDWYGTHQVILEPGSKLWDIIGTESEWVNSFHHQAVWEPAPGFKVTGRGSDGVIEGIESLRHTFAIGVQWHPERMWQKGKEKLALFKGLVEAAR